MSLTLAQHAANAHYIPNELCVEFERQHLEAQYNLYYTILAQTPDDSRASMLHILNLISTDRARGFVLCANYPQIKKKDLDLFQQLTRDFSS